MVGQLHCRHTNGREDKTRRLGEDCRGKPAGRDAHATNPSALASDLEMVDESQETRTDGDVGSSQSSMSQEIGLASQQGNCQPSSPGTGQLTTREPGIEQQ